jgi:hypothetical protein
MSTSGCQRKCAFWYVLLGDVTSKIRRTNNPLPLGFVGPTSFCEGLQEINLSVECMGMMVEDAIVTLLNVADSSFVAQQTTNGIGEVTIYGDIPAGDYLATVSKNDYLRGTHIVRVREAFGPHSVLARVVLSDVILSWLSPQPAEDCIGDDVYFRVMFSEQLGGPYELLIDTENLWYNHHNAWLNHRSGFYHITAHDGNIPLPIDFVPTPSGPWPSTLPMHRPAQE